MPSRAISLSAQQWSVLLRIKTYCFVFSGPQTPAARSTVHLSRSPAEGFPILGLKRCHGCHITFLLWSGCPESCKFHLLPGKGLLQKKPPSAALFHSSLFSFCLAGSGSSLLPTFAPPPRSLISKWPRRSLSSSSSRDSQP